MVFALSRAARSASWAFVLSVLLAAEAFAGTGMQISAPAGPPKNGLRVSVDPGWVDANGYRPIRVELIPWPPGPAPAARTIRVEFKPFATIGGHAFAGVSDFIEIPQGAASVEAVLSVPQHEEWNTYVLEFYEDGEHLEDLTCRGGVRTNMSYSWTEASPAMLFIDRDAPPRELRGSRLAELRLKSPNDRSFTLPDIRGPGAAFPPPDLPDAAYVPEEVGDDAAVLDFLSKNSKIEILPFEELPAKWINYTGFDLVFISLEDLRAVTQQNPREWQAVRDLISTGPTLCVYGVGEDFEHLAALEKLLDVAPLEADAANPDDRGWKRPSAQDYTLNLHGASQNTPYNVNNPYANVAPPMAGVEVEQTLQTARFEREGKPPARPNFVWRQIELGRVVALGAENPFPGRQQDWGWMLNTIGTHDWMWYSRHGLSLQRRNLDYWSFLIPGVGLAPVNSFLVLISLFVVVIGPLNYWFLVRHGRLYLLLVTVPVGALLITASLFGYALITDGLGVKTRVRSFTHIDQHRGRSVSWSRQSYYAAVAPSRGLQFPDTAAVYPIELQPKRRFYHRDNPHWIDWEEGQSLTKGYLGARITSQLMVVQARETDAQVTIDKTQATNSLGVDIDYLVVRDASGEFFVAENLTEGKTAKLSPIAWPDAVKRLQKALADVRPSYPEGYDPRTYQNVLDFGGGGAYYYWGNQVDNIQPEPTASTSVLERALARVSSTNINALAPRNYVALVPRSPEVPHGVAKFRPLQSIHLVVGTW